MGGRCVEDGFPRPRPAHLSKEDSCARMRRVGKGPLPIESVRLALDGGREPMWVQGAERDLAGWPRSVVP